ncbi:hypothetical protein [Streptomyces sp. NPDC127033]|uniref:hypothetical protein n=1 Tax=Streptomyces sp. NPDC127033 TaxID=3347110 RepID=UPI00365596C3
MVSARGAGVAAGAVADRGRTGATRGPVARWTARAARETSAPAPATLRGPPVPAAPEAPAPGAPAPLGPAGSSSTTTTGSESEGSPSPPALEDEAGVSASRIRPVGALSRTACESVPVKDGFCQVDSVPAKLADATECVAGARWIGGSPAQPRPPAEATEAEPEPEPDPETEAETPESEPGPEPEPPAPEPVTPVPVPPVTGAGDGSTPSPFPPPVPAPVSAPARPRPLSRSKIPITAPP